MDLGRATAPDRRALGAAVLAASLLGSAGTIAAVGPDSIPPSTAAAWRTVVGGLGLAAIVRVRRRACSRPTPSAGVSLRWRVPGVAAVVVNQLAFFEAIERTGVAAGTLVTVATVPLAAGLIDRLSGQEPSARWLGGVALGIVGVALLTGFGRSVDPLGVAAALIAGGSAAWWARSAQELMRARAPVDAMSILIGGAALALAPVAFVSAPEALGSAAAIATVLGLGVVTMAAAFACWGIALAALPLRTVASVTLLEPVVATALAVAVAGEALSTATVAGAALVIAGLWATTRPDVAASRWRRRSPRRI